MTQLQKKISVLLNREERSFDQNLSDLCSLLRNSHPHFTWVGFYFADHYNKRLRLGPYSGAKTEHTIIPFGKGICGQVAISNKKFLVPDVTEQDNYIACNINVKSELVIPLFINDINIGQIDVDSNQLNAFEQKDEHLLYWVNAQIAESWPKDYNPLTI